MDSGSLSYSSYLHLDEVLGAQHTLSDRHDELLFIVIHQASELWFKLALHELRAAVRWFAAGDHRPALKAIARVKAIQRTLTEQWSVLATMTPTEYAAFRDYLGPSSGFQSVQYKEMEAEMRASTTRSPFGGAQCHSKPCTPTRTRTGTSTRPARSWSTWRRTS